MEDIHGRNHINHPILGLWGGHIGYSVRPSERQKGYGKEILRLNLEKCKSRNMDKVMITCSRDNIARYRKNYIKEMRKDVGHAPLMGTACGVIIEDEEGEILLQKRRDNGCWGLPGGAMEIGEKFLETAGREVYEEAGIEIRELELFGIYSGEDRIITYPNGDICCVTGIVFRTTVYNGEIQNNTDEAFEHRFLRRLA